MKIEDVFRINTIAKALDIDYFRLNRVVKGKSINGFKTSERKAIKDYIDVEAENCKKQVDEL